MEQKINEEDIEYNLVFCIDPRKEENIEYNYAPLRRSWGYIALHMSVGPSVGRSVGQSVDHIFVQSITQKVFQVSS